MITGQVSVERLAQIPLMVLDATGQGHQIEALLDTGFDGALTLPPELIAPFGLVWRRRGRARLLVPGVVQHDARADRREHPPLRALGLDLV